MNKERRKKLDEVYDYLVNAEALLDEIKDEEEDAFYSIPESLKNSERGQKSEEAIGYLEDAVNCVVDAIDNVNFILEE